MRSGLYALKQVFESMFVEVQSLKGVLMTANYEEGHTYLQNRAC